MKALELGMSIANGLRGHIRSKRLTDVELAAEHHAAALDVYRAKVHGRGTDWELNLRRLAVLRRFATHEHYDEVAP